MPKTKNKKTATSKRKKANGESKYMFKACCGVLLVAAVTFGAFAYYENRKTQPSSDLQDIADTNTASLGEAYQTNSKNNVEKDDSENSGNGNGLAEKELANERQEKAEQYETTKDNKKEAHIMPSGPSVIQPGEEATFYGDIVNISSRDGTCTYRFINGSETFEEEVGVLPNPNYTTCKALTLAGGRLSAGEWSLIIKYNSEYAEGESEAISITVQ